MARVLRLLELLANEKGGCSLSALSRDLSCPKTSLLDLLRALEASGHATRNAQGKYSVGPAAIELGRLLVSREMTDLVEPYLVRLVEATGETALMGVLSSDGRRGIYVAKVESKNPVRYTVALHERRELYASAVGKVLLAHRSDQEIADYLASEKLQSFTERTLTDPAALMSELADIRRTGLAHTEDERVEGASAVAAPIFGVGGRLEAALVLAGPTSRFSRRRDEHARRVAEAATVLSQLMGSRKGGEQTT